MLKLYIDADACPVKEEAYRVAGRYAFPVVLCAKATMRIPEHELITLVVCPGFEEVDDWLAEQVGARDIVITSDIPLAARCLEKNALVLHPKGYAMTDNTIGEALAMREIRAYQRQEGDFTGGPSSMNSQSRSKFLALLDEMINRVRRG
jgi:uncharacterized protein YaiI (UPF0178 family)